MFTERIIVKNASPTDPMRAPSRWNKGCVGSPRVGSPRVGSPRVGSPRVGACVGHVDFMLFVLFSCVV